MQQRGTWGSRIGFVLAAAGSAVGLGNIWKFPYITGENGGGAFVLVYLFCILLIGVPIMLAEFHIGVRSQRNPIGAVRTLAGSNGTPWQIVGWMGVLAAFVIMSFYSVVAGWCYDFVWQSIVLGWSSTDAARTEFTNLLGDPQRQLGWHLIFITTVCGIVGFGVHKGVERASNTLMPALFLLLIGMLVYAMTLDGFGQGFSFLFDADFSKLTPAAIVSALGHAFFTLSLGMGAMITYGSYLGQESHLVRSAGWIVFLDTAIALLAGLIIFPIAFTFGLEPSAGPGLIFVTLPSAFAQLPGGTMVAIGFFLLLSFAALTSAISLVEVIVSTIVDEIGLSRRVATTAAGLLIALFGIPVIIWSGFFDAMDHLSADYLLPLGGLFISLFVGWKLGPKAAKELMGDLPVWMQAGWIFVLRVISPALVLFIFLNQILGWV